MPVSDGDHASPLARQVSSRSCANSSRLSPPCRIALRPRRFMAASVLPWPPPPSPLFKDPGPFFSLVAMTCFLLLPRPVGGASVFVATRWACRNRWEVVYRSVLGEAVCALGLAPRKLEARKTKPIEPESNPMGIFSENARYQPKGPCGVLTRSLSIWRKRSHFQSPVCCRILPVALGCVALG